MQLPLQITFRHIDHSDYIEADIRKHAEKLDTYHDNIISCRVVFDSPHHHKHKGNLYHVSIDVKVPGHEISVSREAEHHHNHQDAYVAIRDGFEAVYTKLKNLAQQRRGEVKHHEQHDTGKIMQLLPEQDFGLIETMDGREIYFHRNSVVNKNFDALEPGIPVRFHEEMGDKGPKASSVVVIN